MLTIEKLKTLFKPQKNSKFYYWGEKPQTRLAHGASPENPSLSTQKLLAWWERQSPTTTLHLGPHLHGVSSSVQEEDTCQLLPQRPPFHPAHMPTPVLRPGQKGTPQKCQNLGGGVLPPHATLLTPHTCHPCHLLAHLQPFGKKHLQRHKQGISEITAATQTQTVRHSGHGGGGLPAPGRAVPSKPPLHRGPGATAFPPEAKHQARAAQNDQAL